MRLGTPTWDCEALRMLPAGRFGWCSLLRAAAPRRHRQCTVGTHVHGRRRSPSHPWAMQSMPSASPTLCRAMCRGSHAASCGLTSSRQRWLKPKAFGPAGGVPAPQLSPDCPASTGTGATRWRLSPQTAGGCGCGVGRLLAVRQAGSGRRRACPGGRRHGSPRHTKRASTFTSTGGTLRAPGTMPAGGRQAGGQEEAPAAPRALCLTPEDRGVIVGRLARAVLRFQDEFLSRGDSPAGLLCQARPGTPHDCRESHAGGRAPLARCRHCVRVFRAVRRALRPSPRRYGCPMWWRTTRSC